MPKRNDTSSPTDALADIIAGVGELIERRRAELAPRPLTERQIRRGLSAPAPKTRKTTVPKGMLN